MKNLDKIRQMDAEAFADWLVVHWDGCPRGNKMSYCTKGEGCSCRDCWVEWLEGEAR